MPTIAIIDSIRILIYYWDHMPPHFHAEYNEFEILIEIKSLQILAGSLPAKQMKRVLRWAKDNKTILLNKWDELNPKS